MKFYVIERDGISENPFSFWEVEAKDIDEAYFKAENESPLSCLWVLNEKEVVYLKSILNDLDL